MYTNEFISTENILLNDAIREGAKFIGTYAGYTEGGLKHFSRKK